ncbi:hypothetical protein J41TS12_37140 [Paenibacillus antibioticophila]|uniref:Uncharacterized protein n=1 Tax=Paenibacillus antibioticophila TaxID=1274374 RepID=A0A919XYH9_9BACL|nr:hypothetical protein [Paenibacillus antibioticophila]GIO38853.1 hypothetical protein J41TS12_37140 [Paenibacillus antibioticophila]
MSGTYGREALSLILVPAEKLELVFILPLGLVPYKKNNKKGLMFNMLICRKSIRRKDGTVVTAAQLGLKAICFEVTDEQHQAYLDKKKKEKADQAG